MEKLTTPQCEVSRLPLPVLPIEPRPVGALFVSREPDWHHHFHPRRDPVLVESIAGLALRKSRMQKLPRTAHDRYHGYYNGPSLPEDDESIFRLCVLSSAGVIPRRAIDPRDPDKTVGLSRKAQLRIRKSMGIESKETVAIFLAKHCANQDAEEGLVEELLDQDTTYARKLEVARGVLGSSIESALGQLMLEQKDLFKEGLMVRKQSPTLYAATRRLIRCHAMPVFIHSLSNKYST